MYGMQIDRRRLLAGGAALAGAAGLALAGCGGSDDKPAGSGSSAGAAPAAGTQAPPAAAAKPPKKGGTLVVDSTEPQPSALVFAFNAANTYLRYGLWDQLVGRGEDNKPKPMLAETFEMKPDYTGVHIKLRQGLEFHNGRKLTAEDVRYSIELFRADKTVSQLKNPGKAITNITVDDERTLTLTFVGPRPMMEDYFNLLPIVDKDTIEQATQMKVINGSGAFKFVSFTPNQGYVMERNPNYWDTGKPYLDKIQGKVYTDEQARTLALQTGELMHTNQVTYAMVKTLRSNKDIFIGDGGVNGLYYAGLVVKYPALADVRVRRALALAVDRKRIASEWGEGVIQPQALPWPKTSAAYVAEDEALAAYDPEQAKSLLRQAGAVGMSLPLDIGQGREDLGQYVQDAWKNIGVNAQLNISEYGAYLERFRNRKVETVWVAPMGFSDAMQPATYFEFAQPVRIPNPSHYEPDSYKQLLDKINEADVRSPQGKELIRRWNRLFLFDDPFVVPLAVNTTLFAMRKNVIAPPRGAQDRPPFSEFWIDG